MPAKEPTPSPIPLIDSHVNLHGEPFAEDLDEVLARAAEVNVAAMITISDQLSSTDAVAAVARKAPNIWRTVGVHPHHAKDHEDLTAKKLVELAKGDDVVGIGECGLDFHYEYSDREVQGKVFRAHIDAARETRLPLIIHSRDADKAMSDLLNARGAGGGFKPLLHCYTGGWALARTALDIGGYVAFSGILSFKNADDVRAVAKKTPLDRIIVETDCPYLAPSPWRGRRNEPAFVGRVVEALAEARGDSYEKVAKATTANFFKLFARARPVPPAVRKAGLA